jgi:hypothetical protein
MKTVTDISRQKMTYHAEYKDMLSDLASGSDNSLHLYKFAVNIELRMCSSHSRVPFTGHRI